MEELVDIDNYNDKLNDIKEKVEKSTKNEPKEESFSKADKKLKTKNKFQKYIILILSCIILFISYHFLLQYIDNLTNQLYIKKKRLLSYQQNLNGSLKEIEQIKYDNKVLESDINQYKAIYKQYHKEYEALKKERERIIEQSKELYRVARKYREKYNLYKKDFENISNTFHSFFGEK